MGIERVLLRTLKFDLQVEHPYRFLPEYGNKLKQKNIDEQEVGKKNFLLKKNQIDEKRVIFVGKIRNN